MSLQEFFHENFVAPHGSYYTLPSTLVYGTILLVAVWFTYNHVIKKFGLRVDKTFVKALVPFIILGALLRGVGDTVLTAARDSLAVLFLVTPGVYVTAFLVALGTLFVAVRLQKTKNVPYDKTMTRAGVVFVSVTLLYLFAFGVPNVKGIALALGIWSLWTFVLYGVAVKVPKYLTKENFALLSAHMLDASATFTALQFHTGLFEEHVLPTFLINTLGLGPAVMFLLKLAVVWPVLYYIDKDVKDLEYRTWLKIVVLILGLALGVRNLFVIGILGTPVF